MLQQSTGEMTWKPEGTSTSGMLHLRSNSSESWQPYTDFPQYVLPDPPGFSEGYATFLNLLHKKWKLL